MLVQAALTGTTTVSTRLAVVLTGNKNHKGSTTNEKGALGDDEATPESIAQRTYSIGRLIVGGESGKETPPF